MDVDNCLLFVRDWARGKIAAGREPPWAWYQYMKLLDAVDSLRRGRAKVRRLGGDSPALRGPASERRESKETTDQQGSEQPPVDETD